MKIGRLAVDPPVVLAPMAGVTNLAFRQLCRSFGGGLYVSEMLTARAVLERNPRTQRMMSFGDGEPVRSAQLYGTDPEVMAAAVTRMVDEVGADHIDCNFGCPAAKVTRKGGGAALPAHPVLFGRIVEAAVEAGERAGGVPVTVKMRIGIDDDHRTFLRAGRIAEDAGAAAIALHARTAEQLYSGSARWEAIGALKNEVRSIPVLGNGDIWEASDALEMMRQTGCDGVVVGRGCLGRPWIFRDLDLALRSEGASVATTNPDLGTVLETAAEHARLLADLLGEDGACRDFRKHINWYLTGFPVGGARRRAFGQLSSLAELDRLIDELLEALPATTPFPQSAVRTPRGHTNGPRPVALPPGWLECPDDPTPPEGAEELVSGG